MSDFHHVPVMRDEVIESLAINEDGSYLDCTLGGGGHSAEILKRLTVGRLYAVDKDADALTHARDRLGDRPTYIKSDFKDAIANWQGEALDGILMDLGVSSYQLDNAERGFSYRLDGDLDMRMDTTQSLSAAEVVNTYDAKALADIIYRYGEDKFANRIARFIVEARDKQPIVSTLQLAKIVESAIPAKYRYLGGNPCKRTFQALRIHVNRELTGLYECILGAIDKLKPQGRICVITFHSLEDRIAKTAFRYAECDCICDKRQPVCTCNKVSQITILTKKPLVASQEELERNTRAESAKLRIAERK